MKQLKIARKKSPKISFIIPFSFDSVWFFSATFENLLASWELWQKIRFERNTIPLFMSHHIESWWQYCEKEKRQEREKKRTSELCKCTWISIQMYSTRFFRRCQNIEIVLLSLSMMWNPSAFDAWTWERPLPSEVFPLSLVVHSLKFQSRAHGNAKYTKPVTHLNVNAITNNLM